MIKAFILFVSFLSFLCGYAQTDSLRLVTDSAKATDTTSLVSYPVKNTSARFNEIVKENRFLSHQDQPVSLLIQERQFKDTDILFYSISLLLLLFALLRIFYSKYINNVVRVFFNTSLRQTQLTDQLLQARLPSLLFNIFFVVIAGFYIYLLFGYYGYLDTFSDYKVLLICISIVAIVYTIKYCVLKFTGWVSGYSHEADIYIFVVFLINKILAIALIPLILVMAFSDKWLVNAVIIFSFVIIILMLLLRFLRSWSILQTKVKIKSYHFLLYIIGVEVLPLFLIYKASMDLLKNNL